MIISLYGYIITRRPDRVLLASEGLDQLLFSIFEHITDRITRGYTNINTMGQTNKLNCNIYFV